ncbi:MAG TPA: geranylgeranyl reductase family protein [Acidimicrobiia bacterium]|nr:geranylgeranyl reductase family protein [Acidimicrobiia bacterium]
MDTVVKVRASADVVVVGAGPAGTAAAITARTRGLDVVVVDRAHFPRDKTCGDGLTAAALRDLEGLGVEVPGLPAETVRAVVLVAPDRWQVELPLPGSGMHAAVVERAQLDAALVDRARALGIGVHEGVAVADVVERPDRVRLRTDDGDDLEAGFVIAADGHYSSVRRARRHAGPDLGTWHAVRQYFRQVGDARLWVLFEPDLLPGYAWVFPLPGGRANVGFGVLRGGGYDGAALRRLWPDLLDRAPMRAALGPLAEPEDRHRAWPIPSAYSPARLADGRVLYAGDAAGVVDPMTGEGIAQAIETGALAAVAVAGGGDAAAVDDRYRAAVHRALGRDLRFAALLQRLLSSRRVTAAAIRAAGLSPWTRRHFARWMFEDYPRAALFTPDRWRRRLLTPSGAFGPAG